jgi:glycosyltransferase involved in cell wall biosynthesis
VSASRFVAEAPPASEPLVSVIIPVYQGERLILGAVRSALRQTHRELEVWVVDDGSSDETQARLATIDDSRLHVLRQANAGTAAARNAALARASGRYIAFLDSDDRWFPEKIATEIEVLRRAPEPIAIGYSSHYAVDDRGRFLHLGPMYRHSGNAFDLLLDGDDFLMPSLCLFDRRIFEAVGNFNTAHYHEDYDFILRASRRFPIYPTGRRLAVYRQSMAGKYRAILKDYERARDAELSLVHELGPQLTPTQTQRLRESVIRSLYLSFLMYGFEEHARRLREEVGLPKLRKNPKGRLGAVFAKTGLNLIAPARRTIQTYNRLTRQRSWERRIARAGLDLRYDG